MVALHATSSVGSSRRTVTRPMSSTSTRRRCGSSSSPRMSRSSPVALSRPSVEAESRRGIRDLLRLSWSVSRDRPDVFLFPSLYTYFPVIGMPTVVGVHDTIAEEHPQLTLPTRSARTNWSAKRRLALRRATRLFTVSQAARMALVERFGLREDRIAVVSEAPASAFRPRDGLDVETALAALGRPHPRRRSDTTASRGRCPPGLLEQGRERPDAIRLFRRAGRARAPRARPPAAPLPALRPTGSRMSPGVVHRQLLIDRHRPPWRTPPGARSAARREPLWGEDGRYQKGIRTKKFPAKRRKSRSIPSPSTSSRSGAGPGRSCGRLLDPHVDHALLTSVADVRWASAGCASRVRPSAAERCARVHSA